MQDTIGLEKCLASLKDGVSKIDVDNHNVLSGIEKVLSSPPDSSEVPNDRPEIEQRIVAFVDLLGTSALMSKITEENATSVYRTFEGILEIFELLWREFHSRHQDAMRMVISDSYVVSVSDEQDSMLDLVSMLGEFQGKCLAEHSTLVRGGVAHDAMLKNTNEKIIGRAFIRAHVIEGKNAIYPRIVVDSNLAESFPACMAGGREALLSRDKDGLYYVNYACITRQLLEVMKGRVDASLKSFGQSDGLKERQKWLWAKTYMSYASDGVCKCCS